MFILDGAPTEEVEAADPNTIKINVLLFTFIYLCRLFRRRHKYILVSPN